MFSGKHEKVEWSLQGLARRREKTRIAHLEHDARKLGEEFQEVSRKALQAAACWFCVSVPVPGLARLFCR